MHWAELVARDLLKRGEEHVVSTGISPSGVFHVGHLRELMTGDMIARAVNREGGKAKLIFLVDDADPLRKIPKGIPESFRKYLGHPVAEVPSPFGEESWADHFLNPFLEALDEIGVSPEIHRTYYDYKEGRYKEIILEVLRNREKVKEILERILRKQIAPTWWPFTPYCENCGRVDSTMLISFDENSIHYKCSHCGYEGEASLSSWAGKLVWRVEWPAKWKLFGVTCEPFGKDHAAAGGSYDTGKEIAREVFKIEPPYPVPYEWIALKGAGAMSSSKGIVIGAKEVVESSDPRVIRFMFAKYQPMTHIEFDPVFGLLNLSDEYQKYEKAYFGIAEPEPGMKDIEYVYWLSQPNGEIPPEIPPQLPYRHAVVLVQIAKDFRAFLEILKRQGYSIEGNEEHFRVIYERAKNWVKNFAPKELKFEILPELSEELKKKFKKEQKELAKRLYEKLSSDPEWTPEKIHNYIHELGKELKISPMEAFSTIYLGFLGKRRGPRAGYFLYSLDRDFVLKRLREIFSRFPFLY